MHATARERSTMPLPQAPTDPLGPAHDPLPLSPDPSCRPLEFFGGMAKSLCLSHRGIRRMDKCPMTSGAATSTTQRQAFALDYNRAV